MYMLCQSTECIMSDISSSSCELLTEFYQSTLKDDTYIYSEHTHL